MIPELGLDLFVIEASIFSDEVVDEIAEVALEVGVAALEIIIWVQILRSKIYAISVHYAQTIYN